ncbi:MAG: ATP-binding protein [Bdellovibrionota bacterium]
MTRAGGRRPNRGIAHRMSTLNLQVAPHWDELDSIRDAVSAFLDGNGCNRDTCQAVVMTASELAENAIKYGDYGNGRPGQNVILSVALQPRRIVVEVRNPVAPEATVDLRRLDAMVQWIRGFQDPFQAYVERLKVVSLVSLTSAESGLGLVRVAYEGQALLDFFVTEDSTLAVSAVHQLS